MKQTARLHVGSVEEMGKRFALVQAGLIMRDENGIRAPYDSIQATVSLSQ